MSSPEFSGSGRADVPRQGDDDGFFETLDEQMYTRAAAKRLKLAKGLGETSRYADERTQPANDDSDESESARAFREYMIHQPRDISGGKDA